MMGGDLHHIAGRVSEELLSRPLTISLAESCTGGLMADLITDFPGISKSLRLGVVAYSNEAKARILGVNGRVMAARGAVSRETATTMAAAVRRLGATDIGVGITGIAGPSGGSRRKPVGLVFVGVVTASKKLCREFRFEGSRREIKESAAQAALELVLETIREEE